MGKKSLKQPKRTPAAGTGDSVTSTASVSINDITELTTAAVATLTTLAEPTAQANFTEFIETADIDAVKNLLNAAAYRSLESEILETLWDQAYSEGYKRGQQQWKEIAETRWDSGYKEGLEETKNKNYELFRRLLEKGKDEEHLEWVAGGHGRHCFAIVAVLEDTGT